MSPKTYFHALLASHRDVSYCKEENKATHCLHQQPINCHFDDLVVTSAFVIEDEVVQGLLSVFHNDHASSFLFSHTKEIVLVKEGRGPPCV
jgi:hypothetical protein